MSTERDQRSTWHRLERIQRRAMTWSQELQLKDNEDFDTRSVFSPSKSPNLSSRLSSLAARLPNRQQRLLQSQAVGDAVLPPIKSSIWIVMHFTEVKEGS